ncbi:MAG: DUF2339 domain-containing protein [Gammaproteobacteria bacterium]|nr:DUF2339 domain-containing protein [Gammaproteobacteria bacterium]
MTPYVLLGSMLGALAGAILGGFDSVLSAIIYGGVIGSLCGWVLFQNKRLRTLEGTGGTEQGVAEHTEPRQVESWTKPEPEPEREAVAAGSESMSEDLVWSSEDVRSPPERPVPAVREPEQRPPTSVDRAVTAAKGWFTTGNVPVMVGVVVALLGVAFFIKYAIDRQLFVFPMWARLSAVALFGMVLLGIGWRLRNERPTYALGMQGGGLAILYLTTYAAFEFYDLLPATVAFAAMVVVTVATGVVATVQDSRTLIVLGVAGGFLAPLLAATDAGSHVALFSYYAVLNAAILTIGWFKAWRILNLLGFAFTFVIASVWGYQGYRPEFFATTEPFLVLFVLMYIGIAVLFARRRPPELRGFVDSAVVFGPPLIGFALQTRLVDNDWGLATSAGALSGLYFVLAALIWRSKDLRTLAWCFGGLALLFLAVAFPLALDERWTSAAWAVQGAMLAWFGVRNGSRLLAFAGVALQIAAAVSFVLQPGSIVDAAWPVLNGYFLGGVLIAVAGWTVGQSFDHGADSTVLGRVMARLALGWGAAWWLWTGGSQISATLEASATSAALGFVSLTAMVGMGASTVWPRLNALALVLLPAAVLILLVEIALGPGPLAEFGWLAWPLAFAAQYAFLRFRESDYPRSAPALHVGTYWTLALLIAYEVSWWVEEALDGAWSTAAVAATVAVLATVTVRARAMLPWPIDRHWPAYSRVGVVVVLAAATIVVLWANLTSAGSAGRLPYLPLLNPLMLAGILAAVAVWLNLDKNLRARNSAPLGFAGALAGLILLSMEVARGVHHYAGIPFTAHDLGDSATFQAGLSLVWGSAGLIGMVLGAMRAQRGVWIGGAVTMGVVIIKLFVVELGNAGTVGRVVSFLGVGVLLLIVGYFAPVPRESTSEEGGDHGA